MQGMLSGDFATEQDPDGSIFVDRDGTLFHHVLNYMRDGSLIVLPELSKQDCLALLKEAEYYGMTSLANMLNAKVKRTQERDRAKLSTEKKYTLKRVSSIQAVNQAFEEMTIHKGTLSLFAFAPLSLCLCVSVHPSSRVFVCLFARMVVCL